MSKVALVCSEPVREHSAGVGIRYSEMATVLRHAGMDTTLYCPPAAKGCVVADGVVELTTTADLRQLNDKDVVVGQGPLVSRVLSELGSIPTLIDLYDPALIENLSCVSSIGLEQYRSDHAMLWHQLSRGDRFVCASEEQRLFYLGFLAAAGRVNPESYPRDPDLRSLIDLAPFGVPRAIPAHRALLPPRSSPVVARIARSWVISLALGAPPRNTSIRRGAPVSRAACTVAIPPRAIDS